MSAGRQHLLGECKAAIESFVSSSRSFQIVQTISSKRHRNSSKTKTLFILDSSFNPPSRAHACLATSALTSECLDRYPRPHRLLLLFSVHNADKSPVPAAFEHRLAMMVVFAQDLLSKVAHIPVEDVDIRESGAIDSRSSLQDIGETHHAVEIDIALTNQPYYNDKSACIASTRPAAYPDDPQHIHITGFDTVTRIFNPKYYPNSNPPFTVLEPFFAKHGLRVTARPENAAPDGEAEVQKQLNWTADVLGAGNLEYDGAPRAWSQRIEIVRPERDGEGVSSTKIRSAVKKQDWAEVEALCSHGVAEWVREFGLYEN